MIRRIMTGMLVLAAVVVIIGCSSTGVTTRAYVDDKERVDQQMNSGNFGYLYGQPVPEDRESYKKTRKIYVVEFTKEEPETDDEPIVITKTKTVYVEPEPQPKSSSDEAGWARPVSLPPMEEPAALPERSSFEEYTVQKNDTLQKISKKFYDTYRKWPQIYEANKDKIKNPDAIKPGIVLQIPVE